MLASQPTRMGISLQTLLADIVSVDAQWERNIQGVSSHSGRTQPGDLFIACVGTQYDGREYIAEAIAHGAAAVLCEAGSNEPAGIKPYHVADKTIPIFSVPHLQPSVGIIAARFYAGPSAKMSVIGVTGTNGKTSCTQYIAKALQDAGHVCGVIGTLGIGFPGKLVSGNMTTPDAITLQSEFANMLKQGADAVAMEVSSHSLVQHRVAGVHFKIAVFTNLTRDHLDYHGDMINYARAKRLLFENPELQAAVINLDDACGQEFVAQLPTQLPVYGYTVNNAVAKKEIPIVRADNIQIHHRGISAVVHTPWGEGELRTRLLGRFNLSNLLAVLTTLCLMQIPLERALQSIATLETVPGRMQVLGGGDLPVVVVDYSHTPDALEKALTALREHCTGKLWCIFGCGGDRDAGKRPLMAQIAERNSDYVIITNDNPRTEDPQKIIDVIVKGLLCPWAVEIIPDRHDAIAHAISTAKSGDVVLIAGKGHEPYQIIGTEKIPFSDAEEARIQLGLG